VKARIADAARRRGRDPASIILVAVTKFAAMDQVRQLIELGHQDFGENRAQNLQKRIAQVDEFLQRHRELRGDKAVNIPDAVRWHMIGHLQRNKVRKVVGQVRLIQSVDSLRLVEEIHAAATKLDQPVELLLQVNVANEPQKYGLAPAAVHHVIDQINTMIHLVPRGLMCMAPLADDPEASRPVFERCYELFEELQRSGVGGERFDILSMGMTQDYEVAIECGANIVRVGSAIFGGGRRDDESDDGSDD